MAHSQTVLNTVLAAKAVTIVKRLRIARKTGPYSAAQDEVEINLGALYVHFK